MTRTILLAATAALVQSGCSHLAGDCAESRCYDPLVAPAPTYAPLWVAVAGGPDDQALVDAAFDADGDLFVGGRFATEVHVGDAPVVESAGDLDALVARFAPNGTADWALGFGDPLTQRAPQLAVGDDRVFVSGELEGTITVGGEPPITAEGTTDAYLFALDGGGNAVWAYPLTVHADTVIGTKSPADLAVGGTAVVVVGSYTGHFGGCTPAPCTEAHVDGAFLQRWGVDGSRVETVEYDGLYTDLLSAVHLDDNGTAIVGGAFEEAIDIGTQPLAATGGAKGLLAGLDVAGDAETRWARALGTSGSDAQAVRAVVIAADGTAVAAGSFAKSAVLVEEVEPIGGNDAFVVGLDPADGTPRWQLVVGSAEFEEIAALAVDPAGAVVFAGRTDSSITLGSETIAAARGGDVAFLGALAADGTILWSMRLGEADTLHVDAVAVDGDGRIAVAGAFTGSLDGALGALAADGEDGFVAVLGPVP